ncbi:hypothetical protein EV361DRAFT_793376, partial [Lentinula raphanica]
YVNYRQYHILHAVCSSFGCQFHTRALTRLVTTTASGTRVTLSDVYQWLGINGDTFANKRPVLAQAHYLVSQLEQVVNQNLASSVLQSAYTNWYPYQLSCSQFLLQPISSWPTSLNWRIVDLPDKVSSLESQLQAVKPLLPPTL